MVVQGIGVIQIVSYRQVHSLPRERRQRSARRVVDSLWAGVHAPEMCLPINIRFK